MKHFIVILCGYALVGAILAYVLGGCVKSKASDQTPIPSLNALECEEVYDEFLFTIARCENAEVICYNSVASKGTASECFLKESTVNVK